MLLFGRAIPEQKWSEEERTMKNGLFQWNRYE